MFLASINGHSRLLERDGQTNPQIRPLDYIPTENNQQVQYFTFLQGDVIFKLEINFAERLFNAGWW
jgi:hypothetical protein